MPTLKPCPFCGTAVTLAGCPEAQETYQIYCKCSAEMCGGFDEPKLIERWNTRASGWIDINDRKPEFGDHCLFVIETSIQWVVSGYVDEGDGETRFQDCSICDQYCDHIGYEADCISHWMPMPDLPAKEGA